MIQNVIAIRSSAMNHLVNMNDVGQTIIMFGSIIGNPYPLYHVTPSIAHDLIGPLAVAGRVQ